MHNCKLHISCYDKKTSEEYTTAERNWSGMFNQLRSTCPPPGAHPANFYLHIIRLELGVKTCSSRCHLTPFLFGCVIIIVNWSCYISVKGSDVKGHRLIKYYVNKHLYSPSLMHSTKQLHLFLHQQYVSSFE